MRKIVRFAAVASALAISLTGCAGQAAPQLAPTDQAFLTDMTVVRGARVNTFEKESGLAKATCASLRRLDATPEKARPDKETLLLMTSQTLEESHGRVQASLIIQVSAKHYCPEFSEVADRWVGIVNE